MSTKRVEPSRAQRMFAALQFKPVKAGTCFFSVLGLLRQNKHAIDIPSVACRSVGTVNANRVDVEGRFGPGDCQQRFRWRFGRTPSGEWYKLGVGEARL